jgi:tetratricopeptide (TPR) repeat protein
MKRMNKRDIVLERYDRYGVKDAAKARRVIKQADFRADAYLLKCIAVTYSDESMFRNETEMRKVFIKRKLNLAIKYIEKAIALKPECRDILFVRGVIYNANGDTWTAIDCYIKIMELGEDLREDANCSDSDLPFVKMILNDARFQLYRLFHDLEEYELSGKFLRAYKRHLRKGVDTIYKPLEKFLMEP